MPLVKQMTTPGEISADYRPLLRHGQAVELLRQLGIRDAKANLAHMVTEGMVRATTLKPNGRRFYHRDSIIATITPAP